MNIIITETSSPVPEILIEGTLADKAKQYLSFLLQGKRQNASQLIMEAIAQGVTIKEIYMDVFQPSQLEVGRLWQTNQISVAQEHYCTVSTQMIMSQLFPHILTSEKNGNNLLAICVGGELHEIGMRIVADFFEMEGWDTYYIGANTPTNTIIDTLNVQHFDIIAISATITYNILYVKELIQSIRGAHADKEIKILVGGRPFNIAPRLWKKVGADGCAKDAPGAIQKAQDLLYLDNQTVTEKMPSEPYEELLPITAHAMSSFLQQKDTIIKNAVDEAVRYEDDMPYDSMKKETIIRYGFEYTTRMLEAVMAVGEIALFEDQITWAQDRLPHDGVQSKNILRLFKIYSKHISTSLSEQDASEIQPYMSWLIKRQEQLMSDVSFC